MSPEQLKYHLNRLLSGKVVCQLSSSIVYIHPPTPDIKLEANRIEQQLIVDAQYNGLLTRNQMYDLMLNNGLWTLDDAKQFEALPSIIETLKMQMWQFYSKFSSKRVEQTRKNLRNKELTLHALFAKKLKYDIYTAEGFAMLSGIEYTIANSATYDVHGKIPCNINNGHFVDILLNKYLCNMLNDEQTREIAKSSLWKVLWNASKSDSIFYCGINSLTNEQISLINWSRMYDSIYESPDYPGDVVLSDDDILDGWLITQSKKREQERVEKVGASHSNKPGLQEIFVPAETREDASRIDNMNDPNAKLVKQQRLKLAQKYGKMKEENMPDAQLTMRQQALRDVNQRMKGKKNG